MLKKHVYFVAAFHWLTFFFLTDWRSKGCYVKLTGEPADELCDCMHDLMLRECFHILRLVTGDPATQNMAIPRTRNGGFHNQHIYIHTNKAILI